MKFMYNSPLFDDEEEEKKTPKAPDPFSERFLKTRQIILTGEVKKELADEIARQLLILDSEDDKAPIYMYIDSPGGDVDAGFAIYDIIRFVPKNTQRLRNNTAKNLGKKDIEGHRK